MIRLYTLALPGSRLGPHWQLVRYLLLTAITLTNVVFPEYCSPTSVSSISSFQKRDLNQSKSLFMRASILGWHGSRSRCSRLGCELASSLYRKSRAALWSCDLTESVAGSARLYACAGASRERARKRKTQRAWLTARLKRLPFSTHWSAYTQKLVLRLFLLQT